MIKKILFTILSAVVLFTGIIAFRKLDYWERSVRIFKVNRSEMRYEGRGRGGNERFERGTGPDRVEAYRRGRERNFPDSLSRRTDRFEGERMGRSPFETGNRGRGGPGRGDFRGGKKVRLRNVLWFLAVFASFTVIAIYSDKVYARIRRNRLKSRIKYSLSVKP